MKAQACPPINNFSPICSAAWCLTATPWARLVCQPARLIASGQLCIDFPRLDIVLRGEYGNLLKQSNNVWWKEKCCLFRHARLFTDQQQTGDAVKPGVRTDLVGLSFYDSRTTSLLHPARQISFPACNAVKVKRCLPPSPILPFAAGAEYHSAAGVKFAASCRNVVNMPPGNSQPRGDFLYTAFVTGFRIIMPSRSPARACAVF